MPIKSIITYQKHRLLSSLSKAIYGKETVRFWRLPMYIVKRLLFALISNVLLFFIYFFVFVSFVSLGVFFCIHSLVLYYLLQPYDEKLEVKSIQHSLATGVTYVLVYLLSDANLSLEMLVGIVFLSGFVYFFVASILIYRLAPKTFKIRR